MVSPLLYYFPLPRFIFSSPLELDFLGRPFSVGCLVFARKLLLLTSLPTTRGHLFPPRKEQIGLGLHPPLLRLATATIKKENRERGGGASPELEGGTGKEREKENKRRGHSFWEKRSQRTGRNERDCAIE